MPQIIVVSDHEETPTVTFRERVNSVVFDSEHAAAQLLERLEWAVGDAHEVERERPSCRRRIIERAPDDGVSAEDYPFAAALSASVVTTAS